MTRSKENPQKPTNLTPFRIEERRYKQRSSKLDLSRVLCPKDGAVDGLISRREAVEFNHTWLTKTTIYELTKFPGLFILPGALTVKSQWQLIKNALCHWSKRTNLDTHYDLTTDKNVVQHQKYSALFGHWLREVTLYCGDSSLKFHRKDVLDRTEESCPSELIEKLRWAILGLEYDWNSKVYTEMLAAQMPEFVKSLCRSVIEPITEIIDYHGFYEPQAGIINYYGLKDSLTAHVDRSELNMDAPLISFNVGHSCILLIGAEDKNQFPDALKVQSGDIVIMSKEARKAYHGVPRILEENCLQYIDEIQLIDEVFEGNEDTFMLCKQFISKARININFRQIY